MRALGKRLAKVEAAITAKLERHSPTSWIRWLAARLADDFTARREQFGLAPVADPYQPTPSEWAEVAARGQQDLLRSVVALEVAHGVDR